MDWNFSARQTGDDTILYTFPFTIAEAAKFWKSDAAFRRFFNALLAQAPFGAFFWELPPVTRATFSVTPFSFVLIDAPPLVKVSPEAGAFKKYFSGKEQVAVFPNLGNDAMLVVPAELGGENCYTHLANFVRTAPAAQQDELWRLTGETYEKIVGEAPAWLSTSGLGVYWLHMRFDTIPKYYRHQPYKKWPLR